MKNKFLNEIKKAVCGKPSIPEVYHKKRKVYKTPEEIYNEEFKQ